MTIRELYGNKWVRFGFWAVLYTLWVIWIRNWWWLFGLIVIFDLYITKKVKWAFWKKKYKEGEKRNALLDWLDALIFAVIVVSFINIFFCFDIIINKMHKEIGLIVMSYTICNFYFIIIIFYI